MGAVAPVVQWTPEDDVLLKNAVEAGASLESLAKGAVEFSRRFTFREVKERWYHLLYDRDTVRDASVYMTSLSAETSTPGNPKWGKNCGTRGRERPPGKRKRSSLRSLYYLLRKRIRGGQFDSPQVGGDPSYEIQKFDFRSALHEDIEGNQMTDGEGIPADGLFEFEDIPSVSPDEEMVNDDVRSFDRHGSRANDDFQDVQPTEKLEMQMTEEMCPFSSGSKKPPLSSFGENQNLGMEVSEGSISLQNLRFSSPLVSMTLWGGMDVAPTLPMDSSSAPAVNISPSDVEEMIPEDKLHDDMGMAGLNDSAMMGENDFVSMSLDFGQEDDDLFLLNEEEEDEEDDDKDVMDGPCLETLQAILSDSPVDVHCDFDTVDSDNTDLIVLQDTDRDELEPAGDQKFPSEEASHLVSEDVQVTNCDLLEENTDPTDTLIMICTLNTEDPDVPCNDDVILPNEAIASRGGPMKLEPEGDACHDRRSRVEDEEASAIPKNKNKNKNPFVQVHAKAGWDPVTVNFKIKTEFEGTEGCEKTAGLLSTSVLGVGSKEETGDALREVPDRVKEESVGPLYSSELGGIGDGEFSMSEEDEISSHSDDEVPHFSDVESMMLDMDLVLSDRERNLFAREVSRYQFLEAKQTLMRFEKSASSRVERSIVSRGAFAVLYGRRLKHFIRKPEVSLGRGTEDIHVDVDLKREGPANKISRRQAIIKMDEQGCFHLKNTGKFPILVSGKEVPPAMQINLASGCLIEIRGMKFIFEVCQRAVSRYVANTWRRDGGQEQNPSFSLVAV